MFDFKKWQKNNPNIDSVTAALVDISGIWRGKRLPIFELAKIYEGDFKMPLSICGVDIWGEDPAECSLVFDNGDVDGICMPTDFGLINRNWMKSPNAFLPLWMFDANNKAFLGDPRQALAHVVGKYINLGLRVVVAFEIEFFIIKKGHNPPKTFNADNSIIDYGFGNILSVDELDNLQEIMDELYKACKQCNIGLDTLTSESGGGQYEVNFKHVADPLNAVDQVMVFRMILRNTLSKYGLDASFMAKTYADQAGNGLHLHFSLLDEDDNNIFDNGSDDGSDKLEYAVAGLLETMADFQLIFAPHLNSYRRNLPGSHAPSHVSWGYDNRMTAIRIPSSSPKNRRIEHRVAGADANPYLVLAAILGGALYGIENKPNLSLPISSSGELENAISLPLNWEETIGKFTNSTVVGEILPKMLIQLICDIKKSEVETFKRQISEFEYQTYLGL